MTAYEEYRKDHHVYALYPYHRLRLRGGLRNPKHQGISALIIQLKNRDRNAVNLLAARMADSIANAGAKYRADVICSVPSSDPNQPFNGIRLAALQIAARCGYRDGTGCVVRVAEKPKAHLGSRDPALNRNTLAIVGREMIAGKRVLLVDDVTTSGRSLVETAKLLREAGASEVVKLAIGETVYYG